MKTSQAIDPKTVLAYENEAVIQRIQKDCKLPREDAEKLFEDTLKFLYICGTSELEKLVPPMKVDEGWHCFLLFTKDYRDFCIQHFGFFIHHCPNKPGEQSWTHDCLADTLNQAVQVFGALSENWSRVPADSHCSSCEEKSCNNCSGCQHWCGGERCRAQG